MSGLQATLLACLSLSLTAQAFAQAVPLGFKQERENTAARPISAADLAELGDPLFNLLLKEKADRVKLSEIEAAIQPDPKLRRLFVVSEEIVSDAQPGAARRAVLAFEGSSGGEALKGNVMLSLFFSPNGADETTAIEAWGWDAKRGRYNYYKVDSGPRVDGSGNPLPSKRVWKLRGTSVGADAMQPAMRAGTCLVCHINGAPVMKELFLPWNNWHSTVGPAPFKARYLDINLSHPIHWPAASTDRFKQSGSGGLQGAETLESLLLSAIEKFNASRVDGALKRSGTGDPVVDPAGRQTLKDAPRWLRPLFVTTEVNLISSPDESGQHPFGPAGAFVATAPMRIPNPLFLNSNLIAGGGPAALQGLGIAEARGFTPFAKLTQQENLDLLNSFDVKLNGTRGDTHFAWFVPEPSQVDNDLIDELLRRGIVTSHFAAAALAIDLETPVFSKGRASLLKYVPNEIAFKPLSAGTNPNNTPHNATDDLLTQSVIAAIDQDNPPAGSPAAEFRNLLKLADARAELKNRVAAYVARVQQELAGPDRKDELKRLYKALVARRKAMKDHADLRNLVESPLLLPASASPDGDG